MPTLVLHGTDDRVLPISATAERLPALVDDLELVRVEGSPHNIAWTHADGEALLHFLRQGRLQETTLGRLDRAAGKLHRQGADAREEDTNQRRLANTGVAVEVNVASLPAGPTRRSKNASSSARPTRNRVARSSRGQKSAE